MRLKKIRNKALCITRHISKWGILVTKTFLFSKAFSTGNSNTVEKPHLLIWQVVHHLKTDSYYQRFTFQV